MSRHHLLLFGVLVCTSAFSLVYAVRANREANDLAHSRDLLGATLADARAEIRALSAKLDSRTEPPVAAPLPLLPPPVQPPLATPTRRRRAAVQPAVRKAVEDPRWKRVESQLAEHRSQLAEHNERIKQTQDDVQKTGNQLDGKINNTKDELNRSIATTHDEVVVLQKRGERNIYEFDLSKSKDFQRVGPLNLSLRKADAKHRNYDLRVMVDDVPLDKKHVNIFEPVWITLSDRPQPIQLVVNKIDKNQVRGYISTPRYKDADLGGSRAASSPPEPGLKSR